MNCEPTASDHETAFVNAFIVPERRERYLSFLANPKRRTKQLDRLNHVFHKDLDGRWVRQSPPKSLPGSDHPCYVIASESRFDARSIPAREVADLMASADFGIVVSFVPGKIAAYKDEAPSEVVWLYRE